MNSKSSEQGKTAMRHATKAMLDNIHQFLIEAMADFLDNENVKLDEVIGLIKKPVEREESELHIRMAEAAFNEYLKTMLPENQQTPIDPMSEGLSDKE